MFERPQMGERAVLVCLDFGATHYRDDIQESINLVNGAGVEVCGVIQGKRQTPDAALFAGKGKVEEVAEQVKCQQANVVIFNHILAPVQERNLERALQCRVIDRNRLILDIFAQRARSHEGKLQVELAQLSYISTRLVRGWTHLERQKGGIGLRGPGETQLETDRRLLGGRVKALKSRLAQVRKQRQNQRRARLRAGQFSVSLVGYTNAGKSTLFNVLTNSKVYAADQLFATLDTTSRKLFLGLGINVVLSDTVGFIRDLPHTLVAAFRATLEETIQADLLLHVVDGAHPQRLEHIDEVNKVLEEIGAQHVPQLLIWNKSDLLPQTTGCDTSFVQEKPYTIRNFQVENGMINESNEAERGLSDSDSIAEGADSEQGASESRFALAKPAAIRVSALTGMGLDQLRAAMLDCVQSRQNKHKDF